MLYLLYGTQSVILNKQARKIVKDSLGEADAFATVKYDASQVLIQEIINDADLPSLSGEKKAILVYHPYFLGSERKKEKIEADQDYRVLINYLKEPNPDTDLLFILEQAKLNEKAEAVRLLKEKGRIMEAKEITKDEWPRYIKTYMQKLGAEIDQDAITELQKRVEGDALRFTNEAQKLVLYHRHITKDDVELLVAKPLEENVFAIFDALMQKKAGRALQIYRDLLVENEEPVRLIAVLANQLRLLSEVACLQDHMQCGEIAKQLGVHEYRVRLALNHLQKMDGARVLDILDRLYQLDLQIKQGQVDRFFAFEMFLLQFSQVA